VPDAVFVLDVKCEHIAVREAMKLNIPIVAIVDTNCDPEGIDFVVPGNDDALRSIRLFLSAAADSILEGHGIHEKAVEDAALQAVEEAASQAAEAEGDEKASLSQAAATTEDGAEAHEVESVDDGAEVEKTENAKESKE